MTNNATACMMEQDDQSFDSPISTLIFMDLETTGLPGEIGKRNVHITELSLIAIDRHDFETDNTLRVLNKLSLCIRPRACVSPSAMYITGLYNDVLQNQEEFDDSVPKMLEFFFRRLRTPICLLAHNGKKFDFPVLQAELKRLNYTLHSKVLCADTLEAFRTICRTPQTEKTVSKQPMSNGMKNEWEQTNGKIINSSHQKDISKLTEHNHLPEVSTTNNQNVNELDNEIDCLLLDDIESFRDIEESTELNEKNLQPLKNTVAENPKSKNSNTFVSIFEDEHTPKRAKINNLVENGKQLKKQMNRYKDPTYSIKMEHDKSNSTATASVAAKRKLFTETISTKDASQTVSDMKLNSITSFTLEKLYCHFFGEAPPQSHYAEADCVALSKVCQKIKEQFLNWLDNNSSEFSTIQPLW